MSICNLINNFSKHGIPIYCDGKQSPANERIARDDDDAPQWPDWHASSDIDDNNGKGANKWNERKFSNKSLCSCSELAEYEPMSV